MHGHDAAAPTLLTPENTQQASAPSKLTRYHNSVIRVKSHTAYPLKQQDLRSYILSYGLICGLRRSTTAGRWIIARAACEGIG